MSLDLDVAVAQLSPHGTFTLEDAAAVGVSSRTAERRAARGLWVPVCPGIYVTAGRPVTTEALDAAVMRWLGPDRAMLSHASAARRHGWDVAEDGTTWISVPWDVRLPRVARLHVHRTRHPDIAVPRSGLPVSSPARTVVDLAQYVDRDELRAIWTTAVLRRTVSVEQVLHVAGRLHHRAGTELVRSVGRELSPGYESVLEEQLAVGLASRGWTFWVRQLRVRDPDGRVVARADFGDVESRMLLETDGFAVHGSAEQQRRDRERDRRLALLGWGTSRYGATDVGPRLEATLDEIGAIRAQRLRLLA